MLKGMWLGFHKTGPCSGAGIQRRLQLKEVTVQNYNAKADMLLLMMHIKLSFLHVAGVLGLTRP